MLCGHVVTYKGQYSECAGTEIIFGKHLNFVLLIYFILFEVLGLSLPTWYFG